MSRYIDKDLLSEKIKAFMDYKKGYSEYNAGYVDCICAVQDTIADMPEVDVVEVKHGKWSGGFHCYECSVCGAGNQEYQSKYCPECGAKMDGDI